MNIHIRIFQLWDRIRQSLWFVPAILTVVAIGGAYTTVEVDRNWVNLEVARSFWFVFDVGGEGARATLSAIAQSVITVTGVVFSVTIVALQLAASQFTSRVLRTFLSDRGNQWVLGIFIATFTYTLVVLRTVGTPFGSEEVFVPAISVTISIALSLVSIGALIYFINHIAQAIRASVIISHVAGDARNLIDKLFPTDIGTDSADVTPLEMPENPAHLDIRSDKAGYLQGLDEDAIFLAAENDKAVIWMSIPVGEFILPGEKLASVWFDSDEFSLDSEARLGASVRDAFVLGSHWTLGQNLERAIVELTDIAVRALSPGFNDPTTANQCIDRIGELLSLVGTKAAPGRIRTNQEGTVRFVAQRMSWEQIVAAGFDRIRHYGANSPAVALQLIDICGRIRVAVPQYRQEPLELQIRNVVAAARQSIHIVDDLARIEDAAAVALGPKMMEKRKSRATK